MKMNKGYLLPMVVIYALIMMIAGFGILHLGSLERISSLRRVNQTRAFYLAEAGVNRIISRIKQGKTIADISPATVTSGNWQGTYAVVIHNPGNPDYAIITGKVRNQTVRIKIDLEKESSGVFSRGIFGSTNVDIKNNVLIDSYDSRLGPYGGSNKGEDGDVASNLYVRLKNNAKVKGSASVSTGDEDDIEVKNNAKIYGEKNYSAEERILPPVDIPNDLEKLSYPEQGDPRISGNYTLSDGIFEVSSNKAATISGGDFRFKEFIISNNGKVNITNNIRLYVEEKFELKNNTKLNLSNPAELYIGTEGEMVVKNNAKLNSQGNATDLGIYIASNKDQEFKNNSVTFYGVIYAPSAKIKISNNVKMFGDIVAKCIDAENNAKIHYDVALRDISPPGGESRVTVGRWSKPSWKERL